MTLRNFGLGKNSMEDRIHEEITFTVSTLEKSIGKTMTPQVMFHNAASNIICQVLFARRYEYDNALIKVIVQCFTENSKTANGPWAMLYDSFPLIRYLPLPFMKAFKNAETVENLVNEFIREHKKTRVPGEPRDFVDCYLDELEKLRKSYGDVYSIFIGRKPAVVINGLKAVKEAMVTKAVDFAGRPQDLFVNDFTKSKGVILVDYGSNWREHRRFSLMTLRNFGLGKNSMEDRIHEEIKYIVRTLEDSVGKTMSPQVMFHNAASNIICQVLFSTRYEYDDMLIKQIVQCFTENIKMANGPWAMLYDTFPTIRNLPLPFQKAFENIETLKKIAIGLINEHKKTRVPGEPRDFIDCYLDELEKRSNDGSSFSEEKLIMNALDLHLAGTDTTSNTLLTAFLYLMNYPHIQERCQQEIDDVLGGKYRASFEDRHKMPYTQAVIHEIQRVANTVPLSVFHCTTKDTELMGYSIPKGTMIIENLTSVLSEEGQWKFPHEFNPENFLDDKGEFVKPEAFMPFSAGPRVCLGEGLARMELFLMMVTLLRKFKFIWPEDAGEPDFTPVFGATLTPSPYRMNVQLRTTH